jgi:hypothetical protein
MKKWAWVGVGAFVVMGIMVAAMIWFVPEGTDSVQEALPGGMALEDFAVVKAGEFQDGDGSHQASGSVKLLQEGSNYYLRFEGYDATPGPDVYFYLTEQANARSTDAVEEGLKLLTPGGRDGGEATKRGKFNIPLPADFEPARWHGITVWCDDFNVIFGTAELA